MRRHTAAICIAVLLVAAGGIVLLEPWHGPTLLSLSAAHGIDTGDLLAFPFVVVAIAVARAQSARRVPVGASPRSWAGPASAIVLGALLLLADVVAQADGGPLVPTGGGTLDGTIRLISGTSSVPVDRWSAVALTYDGATLRLYVNGTQVSSRATTGAVQTPGNPLWIGGNRPYGEHFHGLIDEVRVYDRALPRREILEDMANPVAPAAGLVAAYGFDDSSGTTAADSSGEGNAGEISGATRTRGRYGDALRFDGEAAVVGVPASASLNVKRAMTLSGWIRPSAPQSGWRTIVQREADAYILAASSARRARGGPVDDLRTALLVAAAVWFGALVANARAPSSPARRRSWWLPAALFALGSLADAALAPQGTLIGPSVVALWLGATASGRVEQAAFLLGTTVCLGLTVASLLEIGGVDVMLSRAEGAIARSAALGALLVLGGLWAARQPRSPAAAGAP